MRILKTGIVSLVFGFLFTSLLAGILFLATPMVLQMFLPANTDASAHSLKVEMERLLDVCAYEYRYDTYITRTKTAVVGFELPGQSKMLMRAEGVIKAGVKIDDLRMDGNRVVVRLGAPYVIESYVESCDIVQNEKHFFTEFDMTEDKDASDRVHLQIEEKVKDELISGAVQKTQNILKTFLQSSGFQEDKIRFEN